jgi:hypothetical protein
LYSSKYLIFSSRVKNLRPCPYPQHESTLSPPLSFWKPGIRWTPQWLWVSLYWFPSLHGAKSKSVRADLLNNKLASHAATPLIDYVEVLHID